MTTKSKKWVGDFVKKIKSFFNLSFIADYSPEIDNISIQCIE